MEGPVSEPRDDPKGASKPAIESTRLISGYQISQRKGIVLAMLLRFKQNRWARLGAKRATLRSEMLQASSQCSAAADELWFPAISGVGHARRLAVRLAM